MNWLVIIFVSVIVIIFPYATFKLFKLFKLIQPYQPDGGMGIFKMDSPETMKKQRDYISYILFVLCFWIMIVAPIIDWKYFGENTGIIVVIGLYVIFAIMLTIYGKLRRGHAPVKDRKEAVPE